MYERASAGPLSPRVVLYGALAVSAVLIFVLALQNRSLRQQIGDLTVQQQFLRVGDVVPALHTRTLQGDTLVIASGQAGTRDVLLVFNTRCPWCVRSLPSWKAIAAELASDAAEVRVLGVSLDPEAETRQYAREHALPFSIVRFPDERTQKVYRAAGVPIVLVLDSTGDVLYSRIGSIERDDSADSVVAAARAGRG